MLKCEAPYLKACSLIETHKIEVVTLVPIMLKRMLSFNPGSLKPVQRIICGGAKINQQLVEQTLLTLGDVLYNLYGTTEAGFSILAHPGQLKIAPLTIGKPIRGGAIKILDHNGNELTSGQVGQLHLKNGWMMNNRKERWINTGDLGFVDDKGFVFLAGRNDNMIISGGENVYPDEIENILAAHDLVDEVAVIGVSDDDFGQRLAAYVVKTKHSELNEESLVAWLKTKVARYQMPAHIILLNELPRTAIGKIDLKLLKNLKSNGTII